MDYTRCINFLLTISQHEVFLIFSEHLAEFGITPGQYGVLACLWKNETLTPKEIAGPYRPHPGPEKSPQHPSQTDGSRHGHPRTGAAENRRIK